VGVLGTIIHAGQLKSDMRHRPPLNGVVSVWRGHSCTTIRSDIRICGAYVNMQHVWHIFDNNVPHYLHNVHMQINMRHICAYLHTCYMQFVL